MNAKLLVLLILCCSLVLTGCYAGRGYAYEHLTSQDPGKLQKENPTRPEVDADDVAIGGVYDHLKNNLCNVQPECCGEFSDQQIWYKDVQMRAAVEKNPELCANLPDEAFVIDCANEEPYEYYNKETCYDEAR